MQKITYVKSIEGLSHEVGHIYEHAYIIMCQDELMSMSIPPYLSADFEGETFFTTFTDISVDIFDSNNSGIINKLFSSNHGPSKKQLDLAFKQIQCENLAAAKIIINNSYLQELEDLNSRQWTPLSKQPLTIGGKRFPSPIVYKKDKTKYKQALVEIDFGSVKPIEAAVFSRLAYLISSSISYHSMRSLNAYSDESELLDYFDRQATLTHKMIVPNNVSKALIEKEIYNSLKPFVLKDNRSFLAKFFDGWMENSYTQKASINYFRKTGLLFGSETLAKEFKDLDIEKMFNNPKINISLRASK